MWRTLASLWTWLVLGTLVLFWVPLLALTIGVTWPFDRERYIAGRLFRQIGVLTAKANPLWKFRWAGIPPADPRRPYVVVSNHESFSDILLLSHLPWEMKWLSKAEIMRIPFLGWCMQLAGDIPVWRGKLESARDAMARSLVVLRQQVSVMIFPEGTRSKSGEMLPFKDGAFRLAIEAGVPVLPLVVTGTRNALAKHDWRMNPADATVTVLEPIETTGLTLNDVGALKERVRSVIAQARDRLHRREP
ncbi:MAG: lysophospholipid acyltransferase family protein [Gemmatimonadales bacterium]